MTIARRYEAVRARIAAAASRAGRSEDAVRVVAVSKAFGPEAVAEAAASGIADFGENRAQELRAKAGAVGAPVRWHFVGHLQTNKVRLVAGRVELIHSVDRVDVAGAIARRCAGLGIVQPVLVEVNVSGERAKHGVAPADAPRLCEQVAALAGIEVRGLMTMAPAAADPEDARVHFKALAELAHAIGRDLPGATDLSMGMSGDFEVAVEEGATMVRLGTALFGPRPPAGP